MVDERIADLIQAAVDGQLDKGEREELDAALAVSPDAQALHREMHRIARLLESEPEAEPPPGLRERVLERIELPRRPRLMNWRESWMRPVSYGLAVAAGVLLAVGIDRIGPASDRDLARLVGSMVHPGRGLEADPVLHIDHSGVTGDIRLKRFGDTVAIEFGLSSNDAVEIQLGLGGAGLAVGGIADATSNIDTMEISGGKIRLLSQGRHQFVVFLREVGPGAEAQKIDVSVNRGETRIFSGSLLSGG